MYSTGKPTWNRSPHLPLDIIRQILRYADRPTLAACLRVSRSVFNISGAFLYYALVSSYDGDVANILRGSEVITRSRITRAHPLITNFKHLLLKKAANVSSSRDLSLKYDYEAVSIFQGSNGPTSLVESVGFKNFKCRLLCNTESLTLGRYLQFQTPTDCIDFAFPALRKRHIREFLYAGFQEYLQFRVRDRFALVNIITNRSCGFIRLAERVKNITIVFRIWASAINVTPTYHVAEDTTMLRSIRLLVIAECEDCCEFNPM